MSGGASHRVEGCDIHDTGTGGIVLEGGDRKTLTPAGHEAVNNHIWRFSQHQLAYASGITLGGVGNRAAHNLFHDAPHHGRRHRRQRPRLRIQRGPRCLQRETDDAGAFYKGRNPSCRGNVIRYNFWRDIGSPMGHGTAADLLRRRRRRRHRVRQRLLPLRRSGQRQLRDRLLHGGHDNSRREQHLHRLQARTGLRPVGRPALEGNHRRRTRLLLAEAAAQDVDITRPPYTTRYPALVGFMDPQPGPPRVNRATSNVLVRCDQASSGNWQVAPEENWTTDHDPGFVGETTGNYLFTANAEVFTRLPGFQPIPFDKIGVSKPAAQLGRSTKTTELNRETHPHTPRGPAAGSAGRAPRCGHHRDCDGRRHDHRGALRLGARHWRALVRAGRRSRNRRWRVVAAQTRPRGRDCPVASSRRLEGEAVSICFTLKPPPGSQRLDLSVGDPEANQRYAVMLTTMAGYFASCGGFFDGTTVGTPGEALCSGLPNLVRLAVGPEAGMAVLEVNGREVLRQTALTSRYSAKAIDELGLQVFSDVVWEVSDLVVRTGSLEATPEERAGRPGRISSAICAGAGATGATAAPQPGEPELYRGNAEAMPGHAWPRRHRPALST